MTEPLIVFVIAVFVVVLLFLRPRGAQSGTFSEMPARLKILKRNKNPDAFLGFHTRDEDALYFIYQEGAFFLDYELNTPKKKRHEEAFRQAAAELGVPVIDTTYGEHSVLRVKLDDSEDNATKAGFEFAQKVFGHGEEAIIEFLP